MINSNPVTPEQVVQQNLLCYNKRDIDGFMQAFREDIELYTFPEHNPTVKGLEKLIKFYKDLFEASPKLHSTVLNRILFNNKVIDHEIIYGRMGSEEPVELVVIYEIKGEKIYKLTAIRK